MALVEVSCAAIENIAKDSTLEPPKKCLLVRWRYAWTMQAEDLQLLVTRVMPFGKYEGRVIADLPGSYLTWFARTGFPKGEIGRLLALMHEIDHNGLSDLLRPLRPR